MADVRDYIRLFDANTIIKWFFLIMLIGLVFIGESVVLVFAAGRFGNYPVLAALTGTALAGLLLAAPCVFRLLKRIRNDITWGNYPERDIERLLGVVTAGILMLIPGFVTDALGLVIYLSGLRRSVGKLVALRNRSHLLEAYEYLKLYDL
jgi:UPF0716 protein FxsA